LPKKNVSFKVGKVIFFCLYRDVPEYLRTGKYAQTREEGGGQFMLFGGDYGTREEKGEEKGRKRLNKTGN
jgi:hypothetical protein